MSGNQTIRVMIIEDESDLRDTLCRYLEAVGMSVTGAGSAADLDAEMDRALPHVVVLDINLPGESGFTIAARLRARSNLGIVLMTARAPKEDRLLGLSIGADHYLVKPVEPEALELIIRNLHRRLASAAPPPADTWTFNANLWTLVAPTGRSINLSKAEFALLAALMTAPGSAISRDRIRKLLNSSDQNPLGRNVDTVIYRLRRRVFLECGKPLPIQAVRGVGYVFAGKSNMLAE